MTERTSDDATYNAEKSKVQKARQTAKEKTRPVREKTGEIVDETKSAMDTAATQARTTVADQKDAAANQLHGVAEALRHTSDQLRDQDQGTFARYSHEMANQVDRASGYLEAHSLDELRRDAASFARRQPELFIGGAFTLGLLAARFLKSSAPETHRTHSSTTRDDRADVDRSRSSATDVEHSTPSSHLPEGGGRIPSQRPSSATSEDRVQHREKGEDS
jgi:hypothetical protein